MTIKDVAGKVLKTIEGIYPAGINTIELQLSDVGSEVVLYYTFESEEFTQTMKMILIR